MQVLLLDIILLNVKGNRDLWITSGVSSGLSSHFIVLVAGTGGPLGIALAAFALL